MTEKFILHIDEIVEGKGRPVIAIKYNAKKKKLIIGGNKCFKRNINSVLKYFFEINDKIICNYVQVNKIRYEINNISEESFYSALDKLEEKGFQLQATTNLLNIMR